MSTLAENPKALTEKNLKPLPGNVTLKHLIGEDQAIEKQLQSQSISEKIDLLQSIPEIGPSLARVYIAALYEAPKLSQVGIILANPSQSIELDAKPGDDVALGRARLPFKKQRPIVFLGWAKHAEEILAEDKKNNNGMLDRIAKGMNIDPKDITVNEYVGFVLAHELGHQRDYLGGKAKAWLLNMKTVIELLRFPVPDVSMKDLSEAWYEANKTEMLGKGYKQWSELRHATYEAYENMSREKSADAFAVRIMDLTMKPKTAAMAA